MHENDTHPISPRSSFFGDILRFALIALVVVLPFRLFVAQPFIVNGRSMTPTFDSGEYLIVDQISYQFTQPERGDVIVFRFPRNPEQFYIKRIIGLPGETVTIEDGTVRITNDAHPDGTQLREPYVTQTGSADVTVSLEKDEYFVLGDNRSASSDSRRWGPLERQFIQGQPAVRLYPFREIAAYPGTFDGYAR